jgi:ATP-dependent DNA ligase
MLAAPARRLPEGDGFIYEPKWDGFRCIVFRDGDDVVLGSRNEKPLTRYFPELVEPIRRNLPERCVLDGEIVIAGDGGLDFNALLNRIHPAASRVKLLSESTPASLVAFDVLALGDEDLRPQGFRRRRQRLVEALAGTRPPIYLTPATTELSVAQDWFERFEGAGLDGVVVKKPDVSYREGERVMMKVKHERVADCVVGGFRWHKSGGIIGSLLLGLYDGSSVLHHVGVTASFTMARRTELVHELEPYRTTNLDGHPWARWAGAEEVGRRPGSPSRWNSGRSLAWEPLRPALVCEVAYDHLQGDRFRHGTTFKRWRPDRDPGSCTYEQLEAAVPAELAGVFGAAG